VPGKWSICSDKTAFVGINNRTSQTVVSNRQGHGCVEKLSASLLFSLSATTDAITQEDQGAAYQCAEQGGHRISHVIERDSHFPFVWSVLLSGSL
jgi:hypothetical protein